MPAPQIAKKRELVEIEAFDSNIPVRVRSGVPFHAIRGYKCPFRKYCTLSCSRQTNQSKRYYGRKNNCLRKFEDYELEWIRAKDLTNHDFLARQINSRSRSLRFESKKFKHRERKINGEFGKPIYEKIDIPFENDLMRLFGYYIAESFFESSNGVLSFALGAHETRIHSDISNLMQRYFGLTGRFRKFKGTESISINFTAKYIGKKFQKLFGKGAHNKTFPNKFLDLPKEYLAELFKGWYFGDGYQNPDYFSAETVSKSLIYKIQQLLFKLNIVGKVRFLPNKRGFNTKNNGFCYQLAIGGRQLEVLEKYGLKHPFMEKRKTTFQKYPFFFKDGYVCIPILKTKKIIS